MKKPARDSSPDWGRSKSHVVNVDQGLWSGIHEELMKSTCIARFRRATVLVPLILLCCQPSLFGQAENPIILADIPDISIVRAGENYYMSSTTMHLNPGVPIMKSQDLSNWELVSYAYDILDENNDQLNLKDGKNAYGHGSWASSLRYHDGRFFVCTFSHTTRKTYIFSTKDPEEEKWNLLSSFSPSFHDASLFFEDGRAYLVHGANDIRLVELEADLSGVKQGGIDQVIILNASRLLGEKIGLNAEGSQIFKVNGKYFIFNIGAPQGEMRTALVFRGDQLAGPYEGRIFLKDKGIAQGGIVDTPDGKWFAYLFQDHGPMGRIPFLVPMTWQDGWPVAQSPVPQKLDLPASRGLLNSKIVASDEFIRKGGEPDFPLAWQWNHNPDKANWSLTKRPGALRLTTGRVDSDVQQARNTLTQRTFGPESSAATAIDVSAMKDGDVAGIIAFQKRYAYVGVRATNGKREIVMTSAWNDPPQEISQPRQLASIPLSQKVVHLKVDCDYRLGAAKRDYYLRLDGEKCSFFYSLDGKEWTAIGDPVQMSYDIPHFMGYRFGLFNFATESVGGHVDFDYFRVDNKLTVK